MKVLVAQSDDELAHHWMAVFDEADHRVTRATRFEDARRHLTIVHPDLIVVDMDIQDQCGLALMALAQYYCADCKILAVAGGVQFPSGELFDMSPAVSAILRKPLSAPELLAVAEHLVPERRAKIA